MDLTNPTKRISPEIIKIPTKTVLLLGTPKISKEFKGTRITPKKFKKLTCKLVF